jgi:Flp pilus assembly protein TadB
MRVSDAERSEIADRLSKHYGDGRLDQAEFSERLDRAMSATTQSDLSGLLADLPGDGPPARRPRPHRGHLARFLLLVLAVVIAAAVGQALLRSYLVLIVIAALVFLWLRFAARSRR